MCVCVGGREESSGYQINDSQPDTGSLILRCRWLGGHLIEYSARMIIFELREIFT